MAEYRLSILAKTDIAAILRKSKELHSEQARVRYRALLTAALRHVASYPEGALSTECTELGSGIRKFHIRHSRKESGEAPVAKPVHVIFYRALRPVPVQILRVLHERMEPSRHLGEEAEPADGRRKD
jgi:toxin ParE1/3/4